MKYTFVNSVKGGCGKTTVSLMWALKKADFSIPKACIVDLDILGTAFENIIQNDGFIRSDKKPSVVIKAAEVYLNDLGKNIHNFKRKYKSELKFGDNRVDMILASAEFSEKSSYMPHYGNQYMSGVSYDYFKSIVKRLLDELKKIPIDLSKYDDQKYIQTFTSEISQTFEFYDKKINTDKTMSDISKSNCGDENNKDEISPNIAIEMVKKQQKKIKGSNKEFNEIENFMREFNNSQNPINTIEKYYNRDIFINTCKSVDKSIFDGNYPDIINDEVKTLEYIFDKAKRMRDYVDKTKTQYSDIIFDMPPNSEPYSDIVLETVLNNFKNKDDIVEFILVSSLNRAHINANINWLKDFIKRAMDQRWKLPDKVIFLFNDSGNLLEQPVIRGKGSYYNYKSALDDRVAKSKKKRLLQGIWNTK